FRGGESVGRVGEGAGRYSRPHALRTAGGGHCESRSGDRRADLPAEHLDGQRPRPDVDGAARADARAEDGEELMKPFARFALLGALVVGGLSVAACGGSDPAPVTRGDAAVTPLAQLPAIDQNRVLEHIKVLASDEFEGRLPGTAGEERTVQYISEQFQAAGLTPGNPDGTWVQKVPLVGITGKPSDLRITPAAGSNAAARTLKYEDDVIAWSRHVTDRVEVDASEMIFVGYGVEAPEFQWDDYKGIDTAGKTLVMLVNDPPVESADGQLDSTIFG